MKWIEVSIRKPIAVSMIFLSLFLLGLFSLFDMKTELLPNMEYPVVKITTHWPGASAQDVEKQISNKIEKVLPNIEGVENISSSSSYENSLISVEFEYGTNIENKVMEIQREIFQIRNDLPNSAKNSLVKKMEMGTGAFTLFLTFTSPNEKELSSYLEEHVKPNLESIPGVAEVTILGVLKKQIQIQVNPITLANFNLSPMELYQKIRESSVVFPMGTLMNGREEYMIQALGELKTVSEYENIILHANGNTLRLKDIAKVVVSQEDVINLGFHNGNPATTIAISKSADGSTVEINQKIMILLHRMKKTMPSNMEYKKIFDSADSIQKSIYTVGKSALQGLLLASLFLWLFLKNKKVTLIITIAFPLAISITFFLLKRMNATLNLISLMGLAIGVGMLTDNAVVVVDNIYRHVQEEEKDVKKASFIGTKEVFSSILASTLTSVIVFLPIVFTEGIMKEMFQEMVLAIIFSNLAALIVSLSLIPMLSAQFFDRKNLLQSGGKYFRRVQKIYQKILKFFLKYRGRMVLASFFLSFFILGAGFRYIRFAFMTKQDYGYYSVIAEFKKGSDLEKIEELRRRMEDIVKKEAHTKSYFSILQKREGTISLNVDIGSKGEREKSLFEVVETVRREIEKIPDIRSTFFYEYAKGKPKKDVEFQMIGTQAESLKRIAYQMQEKLPKIQGISDISSSLDSGGKEIQILFRREKLEALGGDVRNLEQSISYFLLGGDRNNSISIKDGNEEVEVLIRLPKEARKSLEQLKNLKVKIAEKSFVSLQEIADFQESEHSLSIDKTNRLYRVNLYANDAGRGMRKIQKEFVRIFQEKNQDSSIQYRWGGEAEKMQKMMKDLLLTFFLSLFLIYALLAAQFESLLFPFLVMGSIPFALVGVILGFLITRHTMDAVAMVGIILLIGIVVNNAIVLLDFIQQEEKKGNSRQEAIQKACSLRLRPILLTSLTTIFGMLPLSLGLGEGSEVYQGLGISVMFGMTFSTFLTLLLLPASYEWIGSLRDRMKRGIKTSEENWK
ncbi:Multidrug resistance protein MdtC [Fusobacterium necrophorum subsp. funduliforme]|uniref:efflux RND transporter permease subunit n=1 Tax=Fusobacterium necrophorum TaxID=859 RepID=UPI001B8CFABA|nr:efflux RND transporter permease subunit [Fusobacterium necrophorum]MBR8722212.1 Multidrug resistance protein MdtC [Fusobacterium necrophorum subsp. funduliforme]